jgi:hypothetical protein
VGKPFNSVCPGCNMLKPRCKRIMMAGFGSGRNYPHGPATRCEDCLKLLKRKYRIADYNDEPRQDGP